ncbi:MAG: hypothetical protein AAF985_02105 [Bacteroidota bacterium]
MEDLKAAFFEKLIEKYGPWERNSARFGTYSYGEIADDLSMSGSQFSKLLYGTATSGMYQRTIKNIERLREKASLQLRNEQLNEEVHQLKKSLEEQAKDKTFDYKYLVLFGLLFVGLGYLVGQLLKSEPASIPVKDTKSDHFLDEFFEREFNSEHISPFLSSGEAQYFCPCSAFEGTWALDKEYIIPIPMGKPGLYYLAKEANTKMKCFRNVSDQQIGKVLIGFEQMVHELWLDTSREPISPKYFDFRTKNYTKAFYEIDFEKNDAFKKVATINSFMLDIFELKEEEIIRKGEPIGRYANQIDHQLCNKYEIDVKDIMENIIGNLVKTVCEPATNHFCNPNKLVENESTIAYDCDFTIAYENLGIGGSYPYTKAFKLMEQNYSDNLLCNCHE